VSKKYKDTAKQLGIKYLFGRWGLDLLPKDPNGKIYRLVQFVPLDGWELATEDNEQLIIDDLNRSLSKRGMEA
jgi:hypothetical protein